MPYRHELFLSYPNIPLVTDWLDKFLPHFGDWLRQALLERDHQVPPKENSHALIFRDDQIRVGQDWPQVLHNAARDSRCALAVVLPEYWESPYCRAEWDTFTARGPNLALPVRFWDSDRHLAGKQFFDVSKFTVLLKDTVPWVRFNELVIELAQDVAQAIVDAPPYPTGEFPKTWVALKIPAAPNRQSIRQARL